MAPGPFETRRRAGENAFTVCTSTAELLLKNCMLPVYLAWMLCWPTLSVEVVKLAVPEELSAALPRMVLPSVK